MLAHHILGFCHLKLILVQTVNTHCYNTMTSERQQVTDMDAVQKTPSI